MTEKLEALPIPRLTALAMALVLVCSKPLSAEQAFDSCGDCQVTQEDPASTANGENGLFFGLHAAYDEFRDDLLVPLKWSGPAVGLDLGWGWAGERVRHTIGLSAAVSVLDNRFDDPGYALGVEVAYAYDRLLVTSIGKGSLFLGGTARWDLHNGFYESWDDEHIYWFNVYSLGPRGLWSRQLSQGMRISVELDLPLVALVARPPANRLNKTDRLNSISFHLTEPQKGLTFATVGEYTAVYFRLSVARRWGSSWLVFSYRLERSSYDSPGRVATFSNRFGVSRRATW